jgi:crotonobetainyl-CoA:carnitine CoA-transferase CaiB-like acyl-CoA transferase
MFDVMLSMLAVPAAHHFAGKTIEVGGKYTLSGAYPFYNIYETSDGKFMTLGALEPKFWANFCKRVGREDLIARQFDDGPRREQLFEEVRAIFKSKTQREWVELLESADCCSEPALSMTEAFEHAQTRAREMIRELDACEEESVKQLGFSYKLSDTPPRMKHDSPALGQHTDELLAEAGVSQQERERLKDEGIIVIGS